MDSINEDCLRHIFSFLPPGERMRIRFVNSNWKNIIESTFQTFFRMKITKGIDLSNLLGSSLSDDITYNNKMLERIIVNYGQSLKYVEIRMNPTVKINFNFLVKILAQNCENLIELSLDSYVVRNCDYSLRYLFNKSKQLKTLSLSGKFINGSCLYVLKDLHSLRSLKLYYLEGLDSVYLSYCINSLSRLCNLEIHGFYSLVNSTLRTISFTSVFNLLAISLENFDASENNVFGYESLFAIFAKMPLLESLKLTGFTLNERVFEGLIGRSLRTLSLDACPINARDLVRVTKMFANKLRQLSLWNLTEEEDENILDAICRCKDLEDLTQGRLVGYSFSFNTLHYFTKLVNLKKLDFRDTDITNEALSALGNNKNLSIINLKNCKNITNDGLINLKAFPKLEKLCVGGMTESFDIQTLFHFKELRVLDCQGCSFLSNTDVYSLVKEIPSLEYLNVSFCWRLSNDVIDPIVKLKNTPGPRYKNILRLFVSFTYVNLKFTSDGLYFFDRLVVDNNVVDCIL